MYFYSGKSKRGERNIQEQSGVKQKGLIYLIKYTRKIFDRKVYK